MRDLPLPGWARVYRREWLRPDLVAGIVIWSIVVPQAVAYAQIAGLPPEAGLMAAPGALLGYALLGTSRSLVVSATTATSAVSAAAVAPLAGGDAGEFLTLSAGLALVSAAVLAGAGALKLGAVADLVSKPVMTGFLFGLGLTIMVAQLPSLVGVDGADGDFFERLWGLGRELGSIGAATVVVGAASVGVLVAGRVLRPGFPATLLLLVLAIGASAGLDLQSHGVDVVGDVPSALPEPSIPGLSAADVLNLIGASFGVLLVSAEAVGVARTLATQHGYCVDPNRDLVALGGSNLLAGLSGGFVQSGGASQTAAADRAGGQTQLASIVCAGLVLLTGAFLAPLFADLPQATLAAVVIVAVAGFLRADELQRFARVRRSALVFSMIALTGVLILGVLQGLVVAAVLSLVYVVKRLSRPSLGALGRDPDTGVWGHLDRHPGWMTTPGVLVVRSDGPLFYSNAVNVKERILELIASSSPPPRAVVLDMAQSPDLDVETLDTLAELADSLRSESIELRLAAVRAPAADLVRRGGVESKVRIEPTISAAVGVEPRPDHDKDH